MVARLYSLTFDIDWAPDFAIESCLDLLDTHRVNATFFATHHTDFNQEIVKRGHVLGIHPNFLPNSSHGSSVKGVIEHCLEIVPNAWCMRTHSLVQSSILLHEIFSSFPQLKLDISLFMHRAEFAQRAKWEFGGIEFDRILYNWEDDAEFPNQRFSSEEDMFFGNLTIFDFHPIHVFLNSSDGKEYERLKHSLNNTAFSNISKQWASDFCNSGEGINIFLRRILSSRCKAVLLSEVR